MSKMYRINLMTRPDPEKGAYDGDLWNWLINILYGAEIYITEDRYLSLPDEFRLYWVPVEESKEV